MGGGGSGNWMGKINFCAIFFLGQCPAKDIFSVLLYILFINFWGANYYFFRFDCANSFLQVIPSLPPAPSYANQMVGHLLKALALR